MERDKTKKTKGEGVLLKIRGVSQDVGFVFKKCSKMSTTLQKDNHTDCGTGVGGQLVLKKTQPQTSLDEIVIKKSETYYKSNFKTAFKELNLLRFDEDHISQIKRTPFWLLFNAIYGDDFEKLRSHCEKNEDLLRKIIMCFDRSVDKFIIGGNEIKLSKLDVNLILGVSGGEGYIPYKVQEYKVPNWIKRCFRRELANGNSLILYKNVIYDKLKETLSLEDGDSLFDVGRLTHCYLLAVVLSPNKNATMPAHLTPYVEDFDSICQYDWCNFILEMLLSQIASTKTLNVGGCAMILPFWLCEHTNLIKPCNDTSFPRFLKWDLKELRKCLSTIDIGQNSRKFDHKKELEATTMEFEAFKTLHDYWSANQSQISNDSQSPAKESGSFQPDSEATENVRISFQPNEDVCEKGETSDEYVEDTYPIATPHEVDSDIHMTNHTGIFVENKTSASKNQGSTTEVESQLDTSLGVRKNSNASDFSAPTDEPSFSLRISEIPKPCNEDGHISDCGASGKSLQTGEEAQNDVGILGKADGVPTKFEDRAKIKLDKCLQALLEKDCELEHLKKQLGDMTNQNEEVLRQSESKSDIILQKDEEIGKLKKEIVELNRSVTEFEIEKVKVLAVFEKKMDKILHLENQIAELKKEGPQKELEDCISRISKMDGIVEAMLAPLQA